MTITDEIFARPAQNEATGDKVPMSGNNRYLIPDDDGEVKAWTRATTLAAELDNPYALRKWELRQAVWGMGQRPDLMATAGSVPRDDKDTLRKVVADAMAAAATEHGSNIGTALHTVFQRHDQGEPVESFPEYFHADIRARDEALAAHGLTILPGWIERVVRCKIFGACGTLDRIGLEADGTYVIIDDKSEKDPERYPHEKAIQLAVYANADSVMNYQTGQLESMPPVRKDYAVVLHSVPGSGECKVYRVDIHRGWAAARIAAEAREWRKADALIAPYVSSASWLPQAGQTQQPAATMKTNGPAAKQAAVAADAAAAFQRDQAAKMAAAAPAHSSQATTEVPAQQPGPTVPGAEWGLVGPSGDFQPGEGGPSIPAGQWVQGPHGVVQQPANGQPHGVVIPPEQPQSPAVAQQWPTPTGPAVPPFGPQHGMHGPDGGPPPMAVAQPVPQPATEGPGIDPATEVEELLANRKMNKAALQKLVCELDPGANVNRHRKPLAEMLVALRNARRAGGQAVPTAPHPATMAGTGLPPAPAQPPGQPVIPPPPPAQTVTADVNDLSLPAVMARIAQAKTNEDLTAVWTDWTRAYGPDSWTGEVLSAGHRRMTEIEAQRRAGGNPLA